MQLKTDKNWGRISTDGQQQWSGGSWRPQVKGHWLLYSEAGSKLLLWLGRRSTYSTTGLMLLAGWISPGALWWWVGQVLSMGWMRCLPGHELYGKTSSIGPIVFWFLVSAIQGVASWLWLLKSFMTYLADLLWTDSNFLMFFCVWETKLRRHILGKGEQRWCNSWPWSYVDNNWYFSVGRTWCLGLFGDTINMAVPHQFGVNVNTKVSGWVYLL